MQIRGLSLDERLKRFSKRSLSKICGTEGGLSYRWNIDSRLTRAVIWSIVKRRSTERINDNGTVKVIDKHLERLPSCHGWCMKTERLSNGTKEKFIWNGRDLFNKDRTRCVHRHDKSFPFHLYLSRLASNWRIYTILSCTVHLVRNRFTKRRFPRTSSYLFIRLHQRRISSNLPENNKKIFFLDNYYISAQYLRDHSSPTRKK